MTHSNEPGSEPLLAWKRANWVQETCLHIQAARCVRLRSIFIGDFDNASLMTMSFYLIVLSMAGLIMMRQVIHLSTFQPPVHNASLDALWPVKDFYRR